MLVLASIYKGAWNQSSFLKKPIEYQNLQICILNKKEWKLNSMKEADYTLMIMTTHGSLAYDNNTRINMRLSNNKHLNLIITKLLIITIRTVD